MKHLLFYWLYMYEYVCSGPNYFFDDTVDY